MDADKPYVPEQAARWFARLLASDCSPQEREAFEIWRRDADHAAAFRQLELMYQHLGTAEAASNPRLLALRAQTMGRTLQGAGSAEPSEEPPVVAKAPRSRWKKWPLAVAALLGLLAVGYYVRSFHESSPEVIYTATDSVHQVELADGTRAKLDIDARLAVRYTDDARAIRLLQGRALFDVTHDARRPFTVDLGDSQVKVLGTRFQVERDPDSIRVILDRGSLLLTNRTEASVHSEQLAPGDQVEYSQREPSAWHRSRVDSAAAIAWSRGRLVFRATPLSEAVKEVNRYAKQKLRLGDASLSNLEVSGSFTAGDSELVAASWAASLPLRTVKQGDDIVLLSSRK